MKSPLASAASEPVRTILLVALSIWAAGAAAALGLISPRFFPPLAALACIALIAFRLRKLCSTPVRAAALAAGLSLIVSVANLRSMTAADTQPTSQQPWELLRHGTLCLNDAPIAREQPKTFWLLHAQRGCIASAYPPGMAIVAAPFYLPTIFLAQPSTELLSQFDKCAAGILSALTVLLLGLALAKAGSPPEWVFAGGAIYGLASSALSLLSQTLWQQTGIALALACLVNAAVEPAAVFAFAGALLAALVRAPDLLMLVPLVIASGSKRVFRAAAAGAAAGIAIFLAYNALKFGSPFRSGYSLMQGATGFTLHEFPDSTAGLLVDPAHGLLVFAPWVLTALVALRTRERVVRACLASALALLCLMSCWWAWWGGGAFGSRMLSETHLPLAFALARVGPSLSISERRLTLAFVLFAFLTHASFPFWLVNDANFHYGPPWITSANPWVYLFNLLGQR